MFTHFGNILLQNFKIIQIFFSNYLNTYSVTQLSIFLSQENLRISYSFGLHFKQTFKQTTSLCQKCLSLSSWVLHRHRVNRLRVKLPRVKRPRIKLNRVKRPRVKGPRVKRQTTNDLGSNDLGSKDKRQTTNERDKGLKWKFRIRLRLDWGPSAAASTSN